MTGMLPLQSMSDCAQCFWTVGLSCSGGAGPSVTATAAVYDIKRHTLLSGTLLLRASAKNAGNSMAA